MFGYPIIRKMCQANDITWDAHEFTFSCYKRPAFLSKDRTRLYFAEAVEHAKANHKFGVWAYVIMPEHVHMLIWCPDEQYSTSAILLAIKQAVGRRAIAYSRRHKPLGLAKLATARSILRAGSGRMAGVTIGTSGWGKLCTIASITFTGTLSGENSSRNPRTGSGPVAGTGTILVLGPFS